MEVRSLKELKMTAVTRCKQPMRSQVGKGSFKSVKHTTKDALKKPLKTIGKYTWYGMSQNQRT
ncbi:hypothetical protein P5673_011782 [Acropora cervicornis]|uniref:Uncharacterized protein n=1 Tax=Acropora cervicornis TaxID=6130 RepID=A0AAD9QN74_ACRCE|nr:hypothetical protein P5673_011782 [Acropora cervicornis]